MKERVRCNTGLFLLDYVLAYPNYQITSQGRDAFLSEISVSFSELP